MNLKKLFRLFISIAIPIAVGFFSSFFTIESVNTWYTTLEKPFFNPPNWIFGPVWTVLYILIGVSFFMILEHKKDFFRSKAFFIYIAQIILNFLWSFFFFGLQNPVLGLINIIVLLIIITWNMIEFGKIKKSAFIILIPYFLWVSFATFLNIFIVVLN